jgi:hypothetical protein
MGVSFSDVDMDSLGISYSSYVNWYYGVRVTVWRM